MYAINAKVQKRVKKVSNWCAECKVLLCLQCFVTQPWPRFRPKTGKELNVTPVCRLIDYIK